MVLPLIPAHITLINGAKIFKVQSYFTISDGHEMCQKDDSHATEDLFSRKSDEGNFLRVDDIDPAKKRLSHIAILLEKLVKNLSFMV